MHINNYILISVALLFVNCWSQDTEKMSNDEPKRFRSFINSFQPNGLPLYWDRRAVFNLSWSVYNEETQEYRTDAFPILPDSLIIFLPNEVRNGDEEIQFRAIYRLKSGEDFKSIIVAKDVLESGEQSKLLLYLVTYDHQGMPISHVLIAGYHIDYWELFLTMDDIGSFNMANSLFLDRTDNRHPDLSYQTKTTANCITNQFGVIECKVVQAQTGFFEGDWVGYRFISN